MQKNYSQEGWRRTADGGRRRRRAPTTRKVAKGIHHCVVCETGQSTLSLHRSPFLMLGGEFLCVPIFFCRYLISSLAAAPIGCLAEGRSLVLLHAQCCTFPSCDIAPAHEAFLVFLPPSLALCFSVSHFVGRSRGSYVRMKKGRGR